MNLLDPDPLLTDDTIGHEMSRFVHGVYRALPNTTLPWSERAGVHRDLGFLATEARSSRRPELLDLLIGYVCEILEGGGLTAETTGWLREARSSVERSYASLQTRPTA